MKGAITCCKQNSWTLEATSTPNLKCGIWFNMQRLTPDFDLGMCCHYSWKQVENHFLDSHPYPGILSISFPFVILSASYWKWVFQLRLKFFGIGLCVQAVGFSMKQGWGGRSTSLLELIYRKDKYIASASSVCIAQYNYILIQDHHDCVDVWVLHRVLVFVSWTSVPLVLCCCQPWTGLARARHRSCFHAMIC